MTDSQAPIGAGQADPVGNEKPTAMMTADQPEREIAPATLLVDAPSIFHESSALEPCSMPRRPISLTHGACHLRVRFWAA